MNDNTDNNNTHSKLTHNYRHAGNNYYENHVVRQAGRNQADPVAQTDAEFDRQAISSGEFFRHFFWRDFDMELREKVIAIKQLRGWTAREVRHLCLTGWLEVNRMTGAVKPNPSSIGMHRYGLALLAWITLHCGCEILSVACSDGTPKQKLLAELGILSVWASSGLLLNMLFFKPYELLTRAKTRVGQ